MSDSHKDCKALLLVADGCHCPINMFDLCMQPAGGGSPAKGRPLSRGEAPAVAAAPPPAAEIPATTDPALAPTTSAGVSSSPGVSLAPRHLHPLRPVMIAPSVSSSILCNLVQTFGNTKAGESNAGDGGGQFALGSDLQDLLLQLGGQ